MLEYEILRIMVKHVSLQLLNNVGELNMKIMNYYSIEM